MLILITKLIILSSSNLKMKSTSSNKAKQLKPGKIQAFFISYDMFSKKSQLKLNQKGGHRTWFGGLLTFIFWAALIATTVRFFDDYFNNNQP